MSDARLASKRRNSFAANKIDFIEKSIANDPATRDELINLGYRAVPVIKVGGETMVGFSAPKLRKMLGLGA
ncbi:glutaredoxin family protein [Candidatus Binatus sp.]|uniref:glutaredoxin family protein n=1 Tax=Candidatus Binatus sp. TaxID=2811406 RepID=UPI00351CBADF